MRKMTLLKLSLSCLLVSVFSTSTMWAGDQADPVKHRRQVKKEIGNNMKAAKKIVGNGKSEALLARANKIQELTTDIPALFPKGSDKGKTDAKPVIWEKWEDFKEAAEDNAAKAKAFATAVQEGDKETLNTTFKDLGASCKACHKDFKAK
jgi:cytochrome c556